MQTAGENTAVPEHRLTLPEVVDAPGRRRPHPQGRGRSLQEGTALLQGRHPSLVVVADQKWKAHVEPHKPLTLEYLAEWLAKRTGLAYLHIDPLKINFQAVTDVMSNAYATRFRILPVEVNTREVVIATSEPYLREWEKELQPILRKDIRRVVANPQDIDRYLVEFYNLARSVKKAEQQGDVRSGVSISSRWSSWASPTASSTPTTSTSSASSTGSGNMPSSSAPATSTSSRGANSASCVSASTACCTRSTRFRCRC
ncbi:MAG: hypothetical protein M5R42_21600 [Rhodocyclaceae bacterium]|nr:hypothetical protein [Rhodocyclaceae bacterium]